MQKARRLRAWEAADKINDEISNGWYVKLMTSVICPIQGTIIITIFEDNSEIRDSKIKEILTTGFS